MMTMVTTMTEENLKKYLAVFNDAWKFFKHYAGKIPMTDDEWSELIPMTSKFVTRHPDHEAFARAMILVVEKELEERDREVRKENGTWEQ